MGKNGENGCLSGITEWYETINIQGFKCKKCDYNLCVKCLLNLVDDQGHANTIAEIAKPLKVQLLQKDRQEKEAAEVKTMSYQEQIEMMEK